MNVYVMRLTANAPADRIHLGRGLKIAKGETINVEESRAREFLKLKMRGKELLVVDRIIETSEGGNR